jgi:secondary thiamine-phosphate synthase enzyme
VSELQTIDIKSTTREEMIDVTALVRAAVKKTGVAAGLACVFCPHTTAGMTIQENSDPDVRADMLGLLRRAIPRDGGGHFKHGEENSDAHIKGSLVGAQTTIVIDGGKLLLGTWQAIYFCEFDGPRERRIHVKVVAG